MKTKERAFSFDPSRTIRDQLDDIGVDWDCIRRAADDYDAPEAELVQFWLDLYGEEGRHTPTADDPGCDEPDWEMAVLGYLQEGHTAGDILAVISSLGTYDPYGEYGGRELDVAFASALIAERNDPTWSARPQFQTRAKSANAHRNT